MKKSICRIFTVLLTIAVLFGSNQIWGRNAAAAAIKVASIEFLNVSQSFVIGKGEEKKLSICILPENAGEKSVVWESDNPKTVSVSSDGTVKGLKKGSAKITVRAVDGTKTKNSIRVTVGIPSTSLEVSTAEAVLKVGETMKIAAKVLPANATAKGVTYSSSDRTIASVTDKGFITALGNGQATVYVTSADGRSVSQVKVTVGEGVIRLTGDGNVKGTTVNDGKVLAWYQVPYAKAPVGELRWRAPQNNTKWAEVYDATRLDTSKYALQMDSGKAIGSEDCLYLSIYRPNTEEESLPVLVFLHGGGNYNGSSSSLVGDFLAANANAVVISVDYRVGPLGWLNLKALKTGNAYEDSGNFGLLDIAKALEWVQDNAAVFGGDKNNVTLAGQSAGGRDVLAAMISPMMEGLFQKAIALSGGMATATPQEGQTSAAKALANLLVNRGTYETQADALNWINTASNAQVKSVLYSLTGGELLNMYGDPALRMDSFPHLFTDGTVLPSEGFLAFSSGNYSQIPLMLSSCKSEFSVFALTDSYFGSSFYDGTLAGNTALSETAKTAKEYGSELYAAFNVEEVAGALEGREGQPDIYAYRFSYGEDPAVNGEYFASYVGAAQGLDLDFINGTFSNSLKNYAPELYTGSNAEGREELSLHMQQYIGNFLRTGNPNGEGLTEWTPWTAKEDTNRILVLNADKTTDISAMSKEYIIDTQVWNELQENLNTDSPLYKALSDNILKGRFFDHR